MADEPENKEEVAAEAAAPEEAAAPAAEETTAAPADAPAAAQDHAGAVCGPEGARGEAGQAGAPRDHEQPDSLAAGEVQRRRAQGGRGGPAAETDVKGRAPQARGDDCEAVARCAETRGAPGLEPDHVQGPARRRVQELQRAVPAFAVLQAQ